jgi:uncharacterized surface protein with fasciclin (FAS1) repeats
VPQVAHNHDKDNIVVVADNAGSFKTLLQAAQAAGLVDTLTGPGPYTVFATTDEAFSNLPEGTLQSLLDNPEQLKAVLLYHVVPGKKMAADVVKSKSLTSAQGSDIDVMVSDGGVTVDGANVIKTDISASNGVIHVIDAVILP